MRNNRQSGAVERRRHERCSPEEASVSYSTGLLSYFPVLRAINRVDASALDLSVGGVCIVVPGRIMPKTRVHLTVSIPNYEESISLAGIVRRCFENQQDGKLYAGIEFLGMPAPLYARVKAMCEYFNSPHYKDKHRDHLEYKHF